MADGVPSDTVAPDAPDLGDALAEDGRSKETSWLDLEDVDGAPFRPTHRWTKQFGGTGNDRSADIAVDGAGNIYVTGTFYGDVDFGGGPISNKGAYDIFLVSFSKSGAYRWSKGFGSAGQDNVGGLAIDSAGHVYVIGSFSSTIDFGGGPLTSSGYSNLFLASFTSSGGHRWSKRFGSDRYASGRDVAVDDKGNIAITGSFQRSINFGGSKLTSATFSRYDIFLASFTSPGGHRWSKRFGESSGNDWGICLSVDAHGAVTMAGSFQRSVNFGGGTLVSAGNNDIVLASYSDDGTHRWSKRFGSAADDRPAAIASNPTGHVFLTGSFGETIDFGGGSMKSAGLDDIYLVSFSNDGSYRWSSRFGGFTGDYGRGLTIDEKGDLLLIGFFGASLDLGGGILESLGANDVYLASFSSNGQHRWSQRFGGTSWDVGTSVVAGPGDMFVATGFFEKSADLGGGSMKSAGLKDIYVTRWAE